MSDNDSILELVKSSYANKPLYKEAYCGVPENYKDITTLGELLESNYKYRPTRIQLRENLISKLKNSENTFNGIIGFEETVIPAIKRALLAGHDILFIGHIGQGKTKLAEMISENLLSPIPVVEGTITNDIPTEIPYPHLASLLQDKDINRSVPEFFVSKDCEEIIRNNKLDTKIKWVDGKSRYRYILATPDISVKDLVGQIDVVKVIKKGIEVFDIDSYSPGYLLQARYGILCLDELPVLDPRKQVTLLSVLQEGRFTTGAYPVFFKPDVKIIATANPIDYTHSGKIIEPLSDRLKSHIETHYPKTIDDEILILIQEMDMLSRKNTLLPAFILKTIVKIFQSLRTNPEINSERGVSVRSTIHSLEIMVGEVEAVRSISNNTITIPRLSDIYCIFQASKFELDEIEDTLENKTIFLNSIINETIKDVSREFYSNLINAEELISIKNEFRGKTFRVLQNQYQKHIQENRTIDNIISGNGNDVRGKSSNSSSNGEGGKGKGREGLNNGSKNSRKNESAKQETISNGASTTTTMTAADVTSPTASPYATNTNVDANNNNSFLYTEQLKKFPITKKILKKTIEKIKEEQTEYIKKAQKNNIVHTNLQYLDYNITNSNVADNFERQEETVAAAMELFLEYLRFSSPPVLDKKENKTEYIGV